MTVAGACVYTLFMLVFGIAFLVDWIRNYQWIRGYLKWGLAIGLTLLGLNIATVVIAPVALGHHVALVLVADMFIFIRAVGFSMLGMYYCARLGLPSVRLAMSSPDETDVHDTDETGPEGETVPVSDSVEVEGISAESLVEPVPEADSLPVEDHPQMPLVPEGDARGWVLHVALVVIVSIVYSIVLFKATSPRMSEVAKQALGLGGDALAAGETMTPQALLFLLTFAFGEEIFFRLGIQNFLAYRLGWRGNKYWLAIIVTSGLWTLGHVGMLEPGWVKLAQIFPLGLVLGWLFKKHGLESAICAHGLFNCLLAIPALDLIR